MKKIHDDSIILCSNRTDRKIPPHGGIIANYYTDDKGFTVFELEHTKREFVNRNLVLDIGYFLLTEEGCYKVIEITYAEKRPKRITCKTVLSNASEIPFFKNINVAKGTYYERKVKPRKPKAERTPTRQPA